MDLQLSALCDQLAQYWPFTLQYTVLFIEIILGSVVGWKLAQLAHVLLNIFILSGKSV